MSDEERKYLIEACNRDKEIKELVRKHDFSCEVKSGSIIVEFVCYSLSAAHHLQHLYTSKAFDRILTENNNNKVHGLTSLTLTIAQNEFDRCFEFLKDHEIMTPERFLSLQTAIKYFAPMIRVDDALLRMLNLPKTRLDEVRARTSPEKRCKTLLTILSRQPNRMFQQLIKALKATQHIDVALAIEQNASIYRRYGNGKYIFCF
jgi:hypothetical protein